MIAVSLFSGAGGFEIGFDRAGVRTVLQAENDPWCLEVLARHWPEVDRVDDVRKVDAVAWDRRCRDVVGDNRIADGERLGNAARAASRIDLIYGGWPCQGNSVAGKRAGLSDERSGLWHEVRRVLSELRPRWFFGENVPGLLSVNRGLDFLRVLMDLDELGYGVAWRIVDGRFFGVPQRRRRVLVVGCLGNPQRAAQVLAVCESCGGHPAPRREAGEAVAYSLAASVRGTGDGHGNAWNYNYVAGTVRSHPRPGSNDVGGLALVRGLTTRQERLAGDSDNFIVAGAPRASDGHHGHSSPRGGGGDNLIAFDWQASAGNDQSWRGQGRQHVVRSGDYAEANSATRVDAVAGSFGVRRLTPLECERLMGWGDDHTRWTASGKEISDSHRYRMCGNGVIATVAEWLGHRLVQADAFLQEARVG